MHRPIKISTNIPLTAKIAVKCIEKGIYLPYSFIHLLTLMYDYNHLSNKQIATLAVSRQIVYSEQVVLNYIAILTNFGILVKNGKGFKKIKSEFLN
jgi:hypothetical protein